ncbi:hypothetical protein HW555_005706 [Spodoptera exigua]|uniref:Zinc finger PHD-type domain-containing protein n=1 Tax=Spodoptera exigua TaxID=7107 RepID=A0A835LAW9_SPOEX|nr:hypothetical protein HW555_005706 [Spodoptera exigua]
MDKVCDTCSERMSDGVYCTVCCLTMHFQCAGITEAGYRKLGDRKLTWRCNKCRISGTTHQPVSPTPKSPVTESAVLMEIRALSEKLSPLESLKEEVSAMRKEFADLKSSLSRQVEDIINKLEEKLGDMEDRVAGVEGIKEEVEKLQARVIKLEEESEDRDQWSRMNNIEIKGITQQNNENLLEMVAKIGTKINYPVSKSQINFVSRVPTREKDRKKSIIVCFCNRYVKEDFIAAARLEAKTAPLTNSLFGLPGNQKIYINDHLTIKNKLLLSKAKKSAAEANFQYVWIKHAKIHARKVDTSPYGNETASTGEGISNVFAKYFRSTYQDPDPLTPVDSPDLSGDDGSTCISSVEISYSEVLRLLKSLDLSKAGGNVSLPSLLRLNQRNPVSAHLIEQPRWRPKGVLRRPGRGEPRLASPRPRFLHFSLRRA